MELAYKDQTEFNRKFLAKKGINLDNIPHEELVKLTKDYIIHMIKELTEVLDTLKFKMHRKQEVEFIRSNTIEELMDTQKFLWGLFQIYGVKYPEFEEEYWRKTAVVEQRWIQESELKDLSNLPNVVGIDIDGVLAEYPGYWLWYLNRELKTNYATLDDAKTYVDILTYERIKSQYRQNGEEMNVKPIDGAKEFLHHLKATGHHIVLLTSRPYKRYYRLFADTLNWLKKHEMPYDAILFDEHKNMKILKEIPNLKWMVEDNARFANSVVVAGYKCYLIGETTKKVHDKVTRISKLEDILTIEQIA